jgi:hypothetical protein
MELFKLLHFPQNPIKLHLIDELGERKKNSPVPPETPIIYRTTHEEIDYFLHEDLLVTLNNLNIKPLMFYNFGSINNQLTTTALHRDVIYEDNIWKSMPMGINWDLTPGTTSFRWYDPLSCPEVMPPVLKDLDHTSPFGIHYIKRYNKDFSQMKEVGYLDVQRNTPYLVRTDVVHQITYTCDTDTRMGISLRFKIDDIPTWERALQVFDQYIIKS